MTYFIEVTEYQTYANAEADFHFSYNANSGGGQSFLGGMFSNDKGKLSSPTILDGCIGIFKFVYKIQMEKRLGFFWMTLMANTKSSRVELVVPL